MTVKLWKVLAISAAATVAIWFLASWQEAPRQAEWTAVEFEDRIRDLEKRTADLQEIAVAMEEAIGKAEAMTGKRFYRRPQPDRIALSSVQP